MYSTVDALCDDRIQLLSDKPHDLFQVPLSIDEVEIIAFNDQERAALVSGNPVFVVLVELFQIFALNPLFE